MKPRLVDPFAARRGTGLPHTIGLDLSIDPGASTGWALFGVHPQPLLVACGGGEPPFHGIRRMAIELPRVYPNHPEPPNDLITLAFLAGRYEGSARAAGASETFTCFPSDWKGNLSKDVCAGRVRGRLTPQELAHVEACESVVPEKQMHNVLDAIGIGLFAFRGIKL